MLIHRPAVLLRLVVKRLREGANLGVGAVK
jgi:hypothetical protein